MTVKEAVRQVVAKTILLMCMGVIAYMWVDLSRKVESGKPFKLNESWVTCTK